MPFLTMDPRVATHNPKPLTDAQMHDLEERIRRSPDATLFAKRAIIWALRQTKNLTENVALSMPRGFHGGTAREVSFGAHDMKSAGGKTHLNDFFATCETEFSLMSGDGKFDVCFGGPNGPLGDREPERECKTIWWSYVLYANRNVRLLPLPTAEELAAINVE